MAELKELDARTRLIALGISIVVVMLGSWGWGAIRKTWYKDPLRVITRMHSECTDFRNKQSERLPKEKQAEWLNKALQECQRIKESCEKNFQQEFCLLAQKQFQNPE